MTAQWKRELVKEAKWLSDIVEPRFIDGQRSSLLKSGTMAKVSKAFIVTCSRLKTLRIDKNLMNP